MWTRRRFIQTMTGLGSLFSAWWTFGRTSRSGPADTVRFPDRPWRYQGPPRGPIAIASFNGLQAVQRAYEMMKAGQPALEAVLAGVQINELDPNDNTVGYGGLPNALGVVELDAAVMDGRTWRAGAVGALQGIKTPSAVARVIMERTDHIFLVGEGAHRFALEYGFPNEDLLTPESRQRWLEWRDRLNPGDNYLEPEQRGVLDERPYGTIHMSALDLQGHLAAATSTSGLAFKIPGRVGDSPIIGAGLYCDDDVGSAGSTGRGEANIKICGAHTIVELMRWGMHPKDACIEALRRVVATTKEKRLLDDQGRPRFQLKFYALRKDGVFGCSALWGTRDARMAVCDDQGPRFVECAVLYEVKEP